MDEHTEYKESVPQPIAQFLKGMLAPIYIHLLTIKFKTDSIKSICRPTAMAVSRNWKLGCPEKDGVEEVVLRVQGIICNRELPPIQRPFEV